MRVALPIAVRTGIAPPAARAAADAMPRFGASEVEERGVGSADARLPSGFAYAAPAYLALFVFINTRVAPWGLPAHQGRARGRPPPTAARRGYARL